MAEDAPPPYSATQLAVPSNGYTKGPSTTFLANNPSANNILQTPRGSITFGPSATFLANNPSARPTPQQQTPRNSITYGPSATFLANNPSAKPIPQQQTPQNTYTYGPSATFLANNPSAANIPRQPSPNMSNGASKSMFPQSFGFYHSSGNRSDMMIALSAESPPMFHVSTHSGFSSQPSVVLHSGTHESSPAIATADFHSFSSSVDVRVFNQPFCLEREGAFSTVTYFQYPMPQPNGQIMLERFEWKSSSGPEVQRLNGKSHGMKCVKPRTGEVVAAWARANSGTRKKGKMSFLMRDQGLGDEKFETMVVISVLSIMEKARRSKKARNGAAAGGAAGGGGGGGGC